VEKSSDKSAAEKPTETASIPAETRRRQPAPREKALVKSASVPAVEPAVTPEEHRDANELARAAIERLRGSNDGSSRVQEASRVPEPARVPDAPHAVSAPPISAPVASSPPPLPPAIMVSTPPIETSPPVEPDNSSRPTPPAEIPTASIPAGPLDLRAEAEQPPRREHPNVAEEMLLAAKSVFHAVLPK
jgi:hypothetical protein